MNYPILAAALIVCLAFLAHTFVGIREALATRPAKGDEAAKPFAVVERNWVQSMCAFQMVTVDLLALSVLLFALSMSDAVPARRTIALCGAALFALWGVAWLLQLVALRRTPRDYLLLSQWFFWLVCAALLYWGAQSL